MSDSTYDTLKGVVARLKAYDNLISVVSSKIYTDVPQQTEAPYVLVEIESRPWTQDDDSNMQHTVRVHGYSDKTSMSQAVRISEYVYGALDRQEANISLDSGTLVMCDFSGVKTVIQEPDDKTWHSIIEFNLIVD